MKIVDHLEWQLDEALEERIPASDPPAIDRGSPVNGQSALRTAGAWGVSGLVPLVGDLLEGLPGRFEVRFDLELLDDRRVAALAQGRVGLIALARASASETSGWGPSADVLCLPS